MKKLITAAFALTVLAVTLGASAADARPRHRICTWHHHHRICRWR
jgi:hypothetical protein